MFCHAKIWVFPLTWRYMQPTYPPVVFHSLLLKMVPCVIYRFKWWFSMDFSMFTRGYSLLNRPKPHGFMEFFVGEEPPHESHEFYHDSQIPFLWSEESWAIMGIIWYYYIMIIVSWVWMNKGVYFMASWCPWLPWYLTKIIISRLSSWVYEPFQIGEKMNPKTPISGHLHITIVIIPPLWIPRVLPPPSTVVKKRRHACEASEQIPLGGRAATLPQETCWAKQETYAQNVHPKRGKSCRKTWQKLLEMWENVGKWGKTSKKWEVASWKNDGTHQHARFLIHKWRCHLQI